MIKMAHFTFEELPTNNHWVDFAKFGPSKEYQVEFFDHFVDIPFTLKPDEVYQIGLDQSTSNTGCFIKNYKNTEAWMIEVSKKGRNVQSTDEYMFDLEMFLHTFCKDARISHLIYERPIIVKGKGNPFKPVFKSSQILFQLEGTIRQLVNRYPEFKNAQLDSIANASWREVVIDDQYKKAVSDGSMDRKDSTARSIRGIYDWTNLYGFSLGNDFDVYEAMGVLFGWFLKSYDGLGRPYVRGDGYNGAIGGFLLPDASAEEVANQLQSAGLTTKWFMQNPSKSIYENISSAVEKYSIVCVEMTQRYTMLALCVECNLRWDDYEKMTAILVAANHVDSRLFEITGKEYHFVF